MAVDCGKKVSFVARFFGTIGTVIGGFFGGIWALVKTFFLRFFDTILPALLGVAIIILIIFIFFVAAIAIGHGLGWIDHETWGNNNEKTTQGTEASPAINDSTLGEVLVDIPSDRKRLEIEIEFLEELLRARKEKLEKSA